MNSSLIDLLTKQMYYTTTHYASQHYNLRSRTHTLQLPEHYTRLSDSNFLVRMLYRDCY